ncbi:MAG: hypothetical protein AAGB46_13785 [Verrucomicrobiota bacterium]
MKSIAVSLLILSLISSVLAGEPSQGSAIFNNDNLSDIDQRQVKRFLMGKDFKWEDGRPVIIAYQTQDNATQYIQSLTGLTLEEFETLWKQLRAEGARPLKRFSNRGALVAFVGLNPGALGIVAKVETDDLVKVAQ